MFVAGKSRTAQNSGQSTDRRNRYNEYSHDHLQLDALRTFLSPFRSDRPRIIWVADSLPGVTVHYENRACSAHSLVGPWCKGGRTTNSRAGSSRTRSCGDGRRMPPAESRSMGRLEPSTK